MTINENAAYLKGLFEGYGIDKDKPEGKIMAEMIKLIGDMADIVNALESENKELREYIEEIDDDLGCVEKDFYFDGDDEDDDDDYDDEDEDDENAEFYQVTCPHCGEEVCFDDSLDPESLVCPACGEQIDVSCGGGCEGCKGCD